MARGLILRSAWAGRSLIVVPALALVALAWLLVAGLVRQDHAAAVRAVQRANANLALALEQHTLRTIQAVDQSLRFVEREYAQYRERLDLPAVWLAARLGGDAVVTLSVVSPAGRVVASTLGEMPDVSGSAYFAYHREHPGTEALVGAPVPTRTHSLMAIPVSRRVWSPEGRFGGVIVAEVDPRYFAEFYRQVDLGGNGMVLLVGLDGVARARRTGALSTTGQDMRDSTLLQEQARASAGHFVSAGRLDGTRRYTSYRTIHEYGLVVAVGTAEEDVMAEHLQRRRYYAIGALAFSLLVAGLAALALAARGRERRFLTETVRSEARFRATFDQALVGIAHVSLDGRLLKVNEALCRITGYAEQEVLGRTFLDFKRPEERARAEETRRQMLEETLSGPFESAYVRKDGSLFFANISPALVHDPEGRPEYFVVMLEDITARKRAEEKLLHQAKFDALTDLPNRALFEDRLTQALHQARRQGWTAGVLFVDVDKFKQVNDAYGHAAGDALLRAVAARLSASVRAGDTAARIGGDEFAVALSHVSNPEDAATVARKILDAMAAPLALEGHHYAVTVSIGIALYPQHAADPGALLRCADMAMFEAKQAGRNAVRVYRPGEARAA